MQTESSIKYSYKPSLRTRLESYLPQLGAFAVLFSICLTVFLIVDGIRNPVDLTIKASGGNAVVSFMPESLVVDTQGGGYVNLWLSANNTVSFAHLSCGFDNTAFELVESLDTKASPLSRVVDKTKLETINQTGRFRLALALEPSARATPPTGNFSLGTLHLRAKYLGAIASLTCDSDAMVYNTIGELFATELIPAKIAGGDTTLLSAAPNTAPIPARDLPAFTGKTDPTDDYSADANGDNQIDMFDLVVWRDHYLKSGYSGTADGDFNRDGAVNGGDYAHWLEGYAL